MHGDSDGGDSGLEDEDMDDGEEGDHIDGDLQPKSKKEQRAEKKKRLKEMFNADYDEGKGT